MQKLTGKEEEVLELMWQLGECAPKDIVAQYPEPQPHVNTIATMVQSLERKGYVGHRPQGRGFIYFHLFPLGQPRGIRTHKTRRLCCTLFQTLLYGTGVFARS